MAGRRPAAVVAGIAVACAGLAWAAAPIGPAGAGAQATVEFEYTGSPQTYEVPAGVCEVDVDVVGAGGGEGYNAANAGFAISAGGTASVGDPGNGARVEATLAVTPGETLHVYVGGAGADGDVAIGPPDGSASATGGAGGWNGGAVGGSAALDDTITLEIDEGDGPVMLTFYAGVAVAGGGGGGASDIRRGGTTEADRIVVAGGGGGSGANGAGAQAPSDGSGTSQRDGGGGGDANGGDGENGEAAANGGDGGGQAGATGGAGTADSSRNDSAELLRVAASAGGGGGGGFNGGDGGGPMSEPDGLLTGGGGGGGAGSGLVPPGATVTDAFRTGAGYVLITPAEPGVGCAPVLQVAKVVSGTAPAGFTVRVECTSAVPAEVGSEATETVVAVDLPYRADGSPDAANAPSDWTVAGSVWELSRDDLSRASCTATETATAGAETVGYTCAWSSVAAWLPEDSGCPGASSGPSASPQTVVFTDAGQTGVLTVTNTFAAPAAAEVSPNFTG